MRKTDFQEILNKGFQSHQQGNIAQAEELYHQALQLKPNHPGTIHSLAVIALDRGDPSQAMELAVRAIELNPQVPQFFHTAGVALKETGNPVQAIELFGHAIRLKHDYTSAYMHLAQLLQSARQYDLAIENYSKAAKLQPDLVQAHYNMGVIFNEMKKYDLAIDCYNRTLELTPDNHDVYNSMASTLIWQCRYDQAIEYCQKAIELKPDFHQAYNTMASAMIMQKKYDQAVEHLKYAIQLAPDFQMAHLNLAIALLTTGNFKDGWVEYCLRHKPAVSFTKPQLSSLDVDGKRILVCSEQGLGDCIQFFRYAALLKEKGATVILSVRQPLLDLFAETSLADKVILAGTENDVKFDCYVWPMDLPGLFETTLETIPQQVPYITACPEKVTGFKNIFDCHEFRIGIVWAGGVKFKNDHNRSCSLNHFAPLSNIENVKLFSLQKGPRSAEIENRPKGMEIVDLNPYLNDFSDTAAAIENLDLVISVDTAVAHLAGAMAKQVWTLLPYCPDWRWMLDRNDTPWYPTMTLFRQQQIGNFQQVFDMIGPQLKKITAKTCG